MARSAGVTALLAVLAAAVASAALTPADFEITDMPLLATPPAFRQYSGYLPATNGTELFFWFVESQRAPSSDPVLFWTNGGPGASSVAYGFWTEHGPFRLAPNASSVEPYAYSWNRIANMLYVEAPSGVGFSWSADTAHYKTNDSQTSLDSFLFLQNFFTVFEAFKPNDFYLTGESYGYAGSECIRETIGGKQLGHFVDGGRLWVRWE